MIRDFDDYVSAADNAHRKAMEECSAMLLEAIRAAREGREPNSGQYTLWRF